MRNYLISLILALYSSAQLQAADVGGILKLVEKNLPAASGEYADAVIFFVPDGEKPVVETPENPAEMRMEDKAFVPRVLTVATGTEVNFPNFDPILHNAFSTTSKNKFDLGLYGGGEAKSHVFDKAGLVRVYCNVHHDMVAYVLVLDTPYFTTVETNGSFSLTGLPELEGEIFVWHPRAKVVKSSLDVAGGMKEPLKFDVDLTKRRVPKHLNKKGRNYSLRKKRNY